MAKRGDDSAAKAPEETNPQPTEPIAPAQHPEQSSSKDTAAAPQKQRWSGGSWKGKSAAVAEIAKESISAARTAHDNALPAKLQSSAANKRFSDRLRTPSKSSATTQLSMSSREQEKATEKTSEAQVSETKPAGAAEGSRESDKKTEGHSDDTSHAVSTWRGWWAGRGEKSEVEISTETDTQKADKDVENTPPASIAKDSTVTAAQTAEVLNPDKKDSEEHTQRSRASWFGLWNTSHPDPASAESTFKAQRGAIAEPQASNVASDGFTAMNQDATQDIDNPNKQSDVANQPASSWAFWSREPAKGDKSLENTKNNGKEVGELAVENTASETHPKPAQVSETQKKQATSDKPSAKIPSRPASIQNPDEAGEKKPKPVVPKTDSDDHKSGDLGKRSANASGDESSQVGIEAPTDDGAASLRKKIQKLQRPNLLVPELHKTFRPAESPSYWQQFFSIFGRGPLTEKKHLSITPSPPKIRKALAIGVHGYFPAPLIAKVLGQPTGTSLRFANGAAAAIKKWTDSKGYSCEIEKVALEGEGMIEHRVESLWKLLLNWIDQIRNADFILLACHSQGVPVAVMLLARLIGFDCLNPQARLGICAMAGVSLGPFPSYHSRILDRSANELFEFSRPHSAVSQKYASALETCLLHHVRIVYIGSIDDQLVSLESALFTTIAHPYIFRAVYVDGRIHAPGFITSLVELACKLRNLGISDHGLIRELSGPLAGSLYTGEGHSRIYEDQAVYELAVEHALETSGLPVNVPIESKDYEIPTTANSNPYFLPWAMRGVLEEEFVRTELRADTDELLKRFESWRPSSKVLKDVKFRLEAVRSKL